MLPPLKVDDMYICKVFSIEKFSPVCICRCAESQPLDAAAWNALGRVEEQRGSFPEAASAYERAEALLADSPGGDWLFTTLCRVCCNPA